MENGDSRGGRSSGSSGSSNSNSNNTGSQAPLTSKGAFDSHLYGETPVHQYLSEIPAEDEQPTPLGAAFGEDPHQARGGGVDSVSRLVESERRAMLASSGGDAGDAAALLERRAIAAREDMYRRQRFQRALSPERQDPFAADGGRRADVSARSYADVMVEQQLDREKQAAVKQIRKLQEDAAIAQQLLQQRQQEEAAGGAAAGKRGRWDGDRQLTEAERMSLQQQQQQQGAEGAAAAAASLASRWDTPLQAGGQAPGWGDTPVAVAGEAAAETAEQKPKKRSRWDATPAQGGTGQVRMHACTHCMHTPIHPNPLLFPISQLLCPLLHLFSPLNKAQSHESCSSLLQVACMHACMLAACVHVSCMHVCVHACMHACTHSCSSPPCLQQNPRYVNLFPLLVFLLFRRRQLLGNGERRHWWRE